MTEFKISARSMEYHAVLPTLKCRFQEEVEGVEVNLQVACYWLPRGWNLRRSTAKWLMRQESSYCILEVRSPMV